MTLLFRYLAKEIFFATLLVLAALLALFALFDLIRELNDVGKGSYSLARMLVFVLLSVPSNLYAIFPVAGLIGAIFAVARLSVQSELTVMRTSGLSIAKLSAFTVLIGMGFAIVIFIFGEFVAPVSEEAARRLRLQATSSVVAQEFRSGFWVKDDLSFINIQNVLPDNTLLILRIYEFDRSYRLVSISDAREASYAGQSRWLLKDVEKTHFEGTNARVQKLNESYWNSVLTPEILSALKVQPEQMSIGNLVAYIDHLRDNRQKSTRYEVALWFKALRPLAVVVMMLLAIPLAIQNNRATGVGGRMVLGILIGIGFYFLSQMFSHLTLLNEWPAAISALTPTLVFLAVAGAMLAWKEFPGRLRRRLI
jgi:lipopolysaccharide export system permease protein